MSNKLIELLNDNIAFRTIIGAIIGFIVLNVGYIAFTTAFTMVQDQVIEATPRESYFDYLSVEFVGREGDSLIMQSNAQYHASYPVYWNDILRCQNGKEYRFTSVQNTNSDSPKLRPEYRIIEWEYSEPFPSGKSCYMDSTITMDVDGHTKRQTVTSKPFLIPTEE